MAQVTFVHPGGSRSDVTVPDGVSLMEAAIDAGIDEILAECGGNATCATCHIYLTEGCANRVPPMTPLEDDMLEGTVAPRRPTSRLSCQLVGGPAVDGLVVELPEDQW
ncbi:2Fe-2S iron-sulfur cluster-binding protein [Tsukamurella sp. PLM1]|uniref:2Fe-2S iron-sulfur cluster-binding protein n=1 Tax=Tsukamurella sp. PLM1 TaxID=2929795 RepID=UPI002070498B|nr:2Fe-2S iron-sulfur cluster-binding protein [Tsukamurella sp. PLM1]BDH59498.1 ferredoxin [Tsukamurella sp. PLM1]